MAFSPWGDCFRPYLQMDHASYLHAMQVMAEGVAQPWYSPEARRLNDLGERIPAWQVLSRVLLPALGAARSRHALMLADVRIARVGLALKCHRQAHGEYPETLSGIEPGIMAAAPEDPFTGKPLVYRRDGAGFVLYSLGENQQDDGGVPEPKKGEPRGEGPTAKWDIVWRSRS